MKIVNLTNYTDFANKLYKQFVDLNDEYDSVSVIALYNEAKQVIAACIKNGLDLVSINIDTTECGEYNREYIITIDDMGIWCEPFKRNNKYIHAESDIIYIFDNCNSKVIKHCNSDVVYEVCTDDCKEENIDKVNEYMLCDNTVSDMYSISLSLDQNGHYENYSYSTSDKSSVNTMLDKIKNICV